VNENKDISEKELDFVTTVAEIFNIPSNEYLNAKALIFNTIGSMPDKEALLTIDNMLETDQQETNVKRLLNVGLDGKVYMLHFQSTGMYVFRYTGKSDLYLNGHHILPDRVYLLDKGASIRGSRINPIYYSQVVGIFLLSNTRSRIVFTARDVEFRFRNSNNGIQKFNFREESGTLVGIMGGSGVGKSTLLNVLNGNLPPNDGKILINGYDIHKNKENLEGVIGFVPQDDLLLEDLTVYQNLYFNAHLCFKDLSEEAICSAVDKVLTDLDLYEIRHLKVGDPLNKFISGGQRKRLNIALELIREPSVLFVDEPTSGLSSMDSEMVMDLLKQQTQKGKLLIINIHQPSSDIFKLFDKLIILDKGGYPIYYGNPIDAVVYFKKAAKFVNADESECLSCGNVNPEQVLQIVEAKVVNEYGRLTHNRKTYPLAGYGLYKTQLEIQLTDNETVHQLPENQFKVPNRIKQFKIFSLRNILSKLANKQYMLINFLEAPILAIILGYFTKYISGAAGQPDAYIFSENENLPAYLFMSVVVSLFLGLTVSAEEIIKDRKILKRESFLHLSKLSYLNSKIVVLFAISAIQTFSFVLIGNLILGVKGMTLDYWFILFTTSCFANMLGLNISAALNSVVTIYILIPLLLVPQLLFSGTIVKFEKLHKNFASPVYVPFVGDIMTSRWAYEALAVVQFKRNDYNKHFFELEKARSITGYKKNYLLPMIDTKISDCEKNVGNATELANFERDLTIVRNEFIKLSRTGKKFDATDKFNAKQFDAKVADDARLYLKQLDKQYTQQYNDATTRVDNEYDKLRKKISKEAIFKLRQSSHNTALADLLLNKQEIKKIIETDDELVQIAEPIYKYPESKLGRAHFFAPVKIIGTLKIDTFWFNALFMWFTSLIMYVFLAFDFFRILIEKSGNINWRIKFKKSK